MGYTNYWYRTEKSITESFVEKVKRIASALVVKGFKKGIVLPKDATNGDLIKALFPNIDKAFSNVIDLNLWWNAPYKAEIE